MRKRYSCIYSKQPTEQPFRFVVFPFGDGKISLQFLRMHMKQFVDVIAKNNNCRYQQYHPFG